MKLYVFSAKDGCGCAGALANSDARAWDWVPEIDRPYLNKRPDCVIYVDPAHPHTPGLKFRYMPKR